MSAQTKKIRIAVFERAGGACEACGRFIDFENGRMDHVFGRAKMEEALPNCWALCLTCDVAKTANEPTAAFWLIAFKLHCLKHAYLGEYERADAKLLTLHAKGLVAA